MIPADTLAYLKSAGLMPLWTAAHRRLGGNGRTVSGRLTLRDLDLAQREALAGLLDRVVLAQVTVDLSELDRRLSASAAGTGLLGVVEAVVGPVPDRRASALAASSRRALLRSEALAELDSVGLGDALWTSEWLNGSPVQGMAIKALGLTIGRLSRTWSRGELAQAVTGTAHGLDDDTPLARLVLRGLSLAFDGTASYPATASARRALWDAAGVAGDTVATTVLTYGLRPVGVDWLRLRADEGAETHLTLREIRRLTPLRFSPQTVYVCENPRVLEAVADAGIDRALVCTMGNPTTVTLALLDAVTGSPGVQLAYHGDFDWPGIAIANRLFGRYGARAWRFGAGDYRRAVARAKELGIPHQPLAGASAETPWDPLLASSMISAGVAIHEEAVIDDLLAKID